MERRRSGSRPERPHDVSKHAVLAFKLEYNEECPLWYSTGAADLDSLQLPPVLTQRLRRWTIYWNKHVSWDKDWPEGHPEAWWTEEQVALPRDTATALGSNCAVLAPGGYIHSAAPPAAPAAAEHILDYARKWDALDQEARQNPGSFRFSAY